MRTITVQQRRDALIARHHLAGDAAGPEEVTRALVALHATDPASVYLSVLARSSTSTLADIAHSLYGTRTLVRWLAMRRTLFVLARDDVPLVHAAVGTTLARTLRTQLINRMHRAGNEPPVTGDVAGWLADAGDAAVKKRSTCCESRASSPTASSLTSPPRSPTSGCFPVLPNQRGRRRDP